MAIDYLSYLTPGIVGSVPQDTDYLYQATFQNLPTSLDLKPDVFEVDDQLNIGSCTANAVTSALEFMLKKAGRGVSLSRLFVYWTTRNYIEDRAGQSGATLRDSVRAVKHFGVCNESVWRYITTNVDVKPPTTAFTAALKQLVTRYELSEVSFPTSRFPYIGNSTNARTVVINRIKAALNEGMPVIFSCRLGKLWLSLTGPWRTHVYPNITTGSGPNVWVGGHAMVIIGYDDAAERFLVENSWGPAWGDGGFGGMPYTTFYDTVYEAFVIRGFSGIEVLPPSGYVPVSSSITPLLVSQTVKVENDKCTIAQKFKCTAVGGIPPYKYFWKTNNRNVYDEYIYGVQYLPAQGNSEVQFSLTNVDGGGTLRDSFKLFCEVYDSSQYWNKGVSSDAEIKMSYLQNIDAAIQYVQKMYIGYYQRPADPAGLVYWANVIKQSGGSIDAAINAFGTSAESLSLYGVINSSTIASVLTKIYKALFNREPDAEGLQFWVNGFNSGTYTAATIVLNVLDGAQNEDAMAINNKLIAAMAFTKIIDPDLDGNNLQVTYSGEQDCIKARQLLALTTSDPASVPSYEILLGYIKSQIADPTDPIWTTTAVTEPDSSVIVGGENKEPETIVIEKKKLSKTVIGIVAIGVIIIGLAIIKLLGVW